MIKGLTDRPAAFPRLGIVRKGKPRPENGKGPGRDSDQFELRDAPAVAEAYQRLYGEGPVREMHVVLPYDEIERVFPCWREEWTKSTLVHRCDGEFVVREITGEGEIVDLVGRGVRCPLKRCKPVGRLEVVVREVQRLGTHTVLTSSQYDIIRLTEQLRGISLSNGGDGGNRLFGVPCVLRRSQQTVSVTTERGRARVTKWLLSIEADPEWVASKIVALGSGEPLPELPAPDDDADETPGWSEAVFRAGASEAQGLPPVPQEAAQRHAPVDQDMAQAPAVVDTRTDAQKAEEERYFGPPPEARPAMSQAPAPKNGNGNANGNGAKAGAPKRAEIRTKRWFAEAQRLAETYPYFRQDDGQPHQFRMCGLAGQDGYGQITDDNLRDVVASLTARAVAEQQRAGGGATGRQG